jgi:hypothetical protein
VNVKGKGRADRGGAAFGDSGGELVLTPGAMGGTKGETKLGPASEELEELEAAAAAGVGVEVDLEAEAEVEAEDVAALLGAVVLAAAACFSFSLFRATVIFFR